MNEERLRMPFGKYKAEYIDEIPTDYIIWCLENIENLRPELMKEMQNTLKARRGEGVKR